MKTRHGAGLVHAELRAGPPLRRPRRRAFARRGRDRRGSPPSTPKTEILDRAAWETLRRLAEAGLIAFTETRARILHAADASRWDGAEKEAPAKPASPPQTPAARTPARAA